MGDRMKRTLLCLSLALILGFSSAAPAQAAMEITEIKFDPRGRERASNENLNREYIKVTNRGDTRQNLKGWKIHDRGRDHVFKFRSRLVLRPDEYALVYSGRGRDGGDTACNGHCFSRYYLYWDSEEPIWNNDGDIATLRRRSGARVDRCRYWSSAMNPKRC